MPSCVKSQASYAHLYISKPACWLMEGLCYKFYYSIFRVYVQLNFQGLMAFILFGRFGLIVSLQCC